MNLPKYNATRTENTDFIQLFGQSDVAGPVLPAGMALTRSGSLQYDSQNSKAGSSHTRTKLPAVEHAAKEFNDPPAEPQAPIALPIATEGADQALESTEQSGGSDVDSQGSAVTAEEEFGDASQVKELETMAELAPKPEHVASS